MKNNKSLHFGLALILILIALVGPTAAQANVTSVYVCVISDHMAVVTFAPDGHCKQQLRLTIASGSTSTSLQDLQALYAHVREILIQMGLLIPDTNPTSPTTPSIPFPPPMPFNPLPSGPGFPPNLPNFNASSSGSGVGVTVENQGDGLAHVTVRNGNQQSSYVVTVDRNDPGSD